MSQQFISRVYMMKDRPGLVVYVAGSDAVTWMASLSDIIKQIFNKNVHNRTVELQHEEIKNKHFSQPLYLRVIYDPPDPANRILIVQCRGEVGLQSLLGYRNRGELKDEAYKASKHHIVFRKFTIYINFYTELESEGYYWDDLIYKKLHKLALYKSTNQRE